MIGRNLVGVARCLLCTRQADEEARMESTTIIGTMTPGNNFRDHTTQTRMSRSSVLVDLDSRGNKAVFGIEDTSNIIDDGTRTCGRCSGVQRRL